MFVKICGITSAVDATAAVEAGADAVGVNFAADSRRKVDLGSARAIVDVVQDHVLTVGIFQEQSVDEILAITSELGLGAAQLHGEYSPGAITSIAAEVETVIVAISAERATTLSIEQLGADVVMLDAPVPGGGVPFDWDVVGDLVTQHRILLAGGLGPDNVAEAIRRVRPWGVDVASGVETSPGTKDHELVRQFVAEARRSDGRS